MGSAARRSSSLISRRAAATARSLADHRGRRGQQVGGVGRGEAEPGTRRRPLELGDDHVVAVHEQVVPVEAAVRDAGVPQAGELLPRVVEHCVGDLLDRSFEERECREVVLDQHRDRAGVAGEHDARDEYADFRGQELDVRLVLHLLVPGPQVRAR